MRRWPGVLCALSLGIFSLAPDALANCQNEGPYPVTQCATRGGNPAWFAAKPADAGSVSATWWILGAGNRPAVDPTNGVSTGPVDGDGFIDTPNPGVFIGVDSGALTAGPATGAPTGGLDLIDAAIGTGNPMAAGGLCFSASANWALPFVDGCSDQNRTYSTLGAGVDASDDYIDPYFSPATGGPGIHTDYALVDAPMGVLLTESTNRFFAVAFFSSTNRNHNPDDIFDKGYDMGTITNGDTNPAAPAGNKNIVPWQVIPQLTGAAWLDPNGGFGMSFSWHHIRLIRDNSSRPNLSAVTDPASGRHTIGKDRNGNPLIGVGILQQPELVSYIVESKPIAVFDCDANSPWTPVAPAIVPAISTAPGAHMFLSAAIDESSCLRLRTRFGRIPAETFATTPATLATRNSNRFAAQAGNLGDLGYEVTSFVVRIGSPLASDTPIMRRAWLERRNLVVEFETLGELGSQIFEVVGKDRRGAVSILAIVECAQCSSGIGSQYRVVVPASDLRSAKSVYVVSQPSGAASDEMEIAPGARPASPERGSRR